MQDLKKNIKTKYSLQLQQKKLLSAKRTMRTFTETAQDFESWILQSKKHFFIAEMAWNEFWEARDFSKKTDMDSLRQVALIECAMMHWGFSIENSAKGVLVAKDPTIISDGKISKISWGDTGHEISEIVKLVKEKLDSKEIDLLDRAQSFIIWAGRYPTPMKEVNYIKDKSNHKLSMSSSDKDTYEKLHSNLEQLAYETANKNA